MTEHYEVLDTLVRELALADEHLKAAEVSDMFRTTVLAVRHELSKLRDTARSRLQWALEQEKKKEAEHAE